MTEIKIQDVVVDGVRSRVRVGGSAPSIDRLVHDTDAKSKSSMLKLYRATPDPGGMTVSFAERLKPLHAA